MLRVCAHQAWRGVQGQVLQLLECCANQMRMVPRQTLCLESVHGACASYYRSSRSWPAWCTEESSKPNTWTSHALSADKKVPHTACNSISRAHARRFDDRTRFYTSTRTGTQIYVDVTNNKAINFVLPACLSYKGITQTDNEQRAPLTPSHSKKKVRVRNNKPIQEKKSRKPS